MYERIAQFKNENTIFNFGVERNRTGAWTIDKDGKHKLAVTKWSKRGDTWYDDVHKEHKVSKEIIDIIIELYSINN